VRAVERVRFAVLAAQREGNRWLAANVRPLGLTPSQAEVLRVLGDHAPLSLSGLGSLLVCESGTNPSRLVDRLVESGLVARTVPTEGDRRQVILELTEEGGVLEKQVREVEQRLYADLERVGTPEQLDALLDVLGRVLAGSPSGAALENRIAAYENRDAEG
jgi:DNA-binding MarR family transcriptional regulator